MNTNSKLTDVNSQPLPRCCLRRFVRYIRWFKNNGPTAMRGFIPSLMLVLLVTSCSFKNPSSFVGSWKAGEQGVFSSAVVLILKSDGTGEINAAMGIFASARGAIRWKKEKDKLILEEANGKITQLTILGKTETTMTLRGPDGSITSYTKIG